MQNRLGGCEFCNLRDSGEFTVHEGKESIAFLDFKPVFPGHTLVAPRKHYETIDKVPDDELGPFFREVKLVARGVERAMKADGTFVAINNKVSQSVPHLHVHIIPRRFHDGMHGFFWPRSGYESREERERVRKLISEAVSELARE